ncbi:hypothetical protein [Salinigranum halophilum]|uniref:hypothetical protein n=1 Tax=Salinigranum halophilum TaxID=2565931 RepID=UPI0010A7870D|nr:hypothetical protein [Salinigranum halophilum]
MENADEPDVGVLDEALLRVVARRLGQLTIVERVSVFPSAKPESVVAQFATEYYPQQVETVTLELRTYVGGDFSVSYREEWGGGSWMSRWDRHDNPHNTRDHFHHPPDAGTEDAVDRAYPVDFLKMIEVVLQDIDDRIGEVWGDAR